MDAATVGTQVTVSRGMLLSPTGTVGLILDGSTIVSVECGGGVGGGGGIGGTH